MKKKKLDLKKLKVDSFITDKKKLTGGKEVGIITDLPSWLWTGCDCTDGCTDGCTRTQFPCLQTEWNCTEGGCTRDCLQ